MVAFTEVRDKLLTLDQVRERVATTEPLDTKYLSQSDKIRFAFEPSWALALDSRKGTDPVDAVIRVNGRDHQLTKDAAIQAGSSFGLTGVYAQRVPSNLLENHLNYWYSSAGLGDREFNMLSTGADSHVAAFTRPTIHPYSNRLLLENVLNGIQEHYGSQEVFADYKMNHSLVRTDIRLILPEVTRSITNGGMPDVPTGFEDVWSAGIHLTNSLIGKSQTKLEGYLFRWWCANGAITQLPDVGAWSRRGATEEEDVYQWALTSIENVLGGLEYQFDQVQALTQLNVSGNVQNIVGEIFDNYDVPKTSVSRFLTHLSNRKTCPCTQS